MESKAPPVPTWDEFFMKHAYLASTKSKDPNTRIGAVLVRDRRIISEGFNGICQGVDDAKPERLVRPAKYIWFEHAERNAIFGCARHGIDTLDSTMFTQGVPCCDCARSVIQAGVRRLVLHQQWEDRSGLKDNPKWTESCLASLEMLKEAGVLIRYLDSELALEGYCDSKLFKV